MEKEFLIRYYYVGNTTSVRKVIRKFTQGTSDTFHQCYLADNAILLIKQNPSKNESFSWVEIVENTIKQGLTRNLGSLLGKKWKVDLELSMFPCIIKFNL